MVVLVLLMVVEVVAVAVLLLWLLLDEETSPELTADVKAMHDNDNVDDDGDEWGGDKAEELLQLETLGKSTQLVIKGSIENSSRSLATHGVKCLWE
jgi:hypothetical protein